MKINKILFITLSNIGDAVLTLPVLDVLRDKFPQAQITLLTGVRPKEMFNNNPAIKELIVYNKQGKLKEKIHLFNLLRREGFDMIIDLRNTLFGVLLTARHKTSALLKIPSKLIHMKERHLYKLSAISSQLSVKESSIIPRASLCITSKDEDYINKTLAGNRISESDKIVVISPGARSHIKRWSQDKFAELIKLLIDDFGVKVVLVGDREDISINSHIASNLKYSLLDLTGRTTILELTYLLKRAALVITNDSAILHLASYLDKAIVAIFGPTNEIKYGPWSREQAIVKKEIFCRPCEKAQCRFGTLDCMNLIKLEDVLRKVRSILTNENREPITDNREQYKRILIARTDRIGDVILSTPVIKALRISYPDAYIAMMVTPYAKDILKGNPYLDELIIYDKGARQRSWFSSLRFADTLKKKKFDLAIILHPTNRAHLLSFFAGIRRRVGYSRKFAFLLTDRIKHTKELGEKHELEYNLDLLRHLNIETDDKNLFMPIQAESEKWVDRLFAEREIGKSDRLLAVHPGASCSSKIWPSERFAELSDLLIERYKVKVLVVSGPKDTITAKNFIKHMHHPVINISGATSISQLASILKRCELFISNDSGPVHIASALEVPVISIFGRNQKGLSPRRWAPVGKKDILIHKEVGCIECLAHNCVKNFACLKAIGVEDVLKAAEPFFSKTGTPN